MVGILVGIKDFIKWRPQGDFLRLCSGQVHLVADVKGKEKALSRHF